MTITVLKLLISLICNGYMTCHTKRDNLGIAKSIHLSQTPRTAQPDQDNFFPLF